MPTYLLQGDQEVSIAAGPIRVQMHTSNDVAVRISAESGGEPVSSVIVAGTNMVVIPRITSATSIVVAPADSDVFPAGTTLTASISIEGPSTPDPERIVRSAVDAAGLASRELVVLESRDGRLIARANDGAQDALVLSGLSLIAQVVTREVLGTDRVDESSAINIVMATDGSASMLANTRSGAVRAILDVLTGLSSVVSPRRQVSVARVSDHAAWVTHEGLADITDQHERLSIETPLGLEFRSASSELLARHADENTVTYVITDALPADHDQLLAANTVDGEARHLVLLVDAEVIRLQGGAGDIPTTIIPPVRSEEGLAGRLEFDRSALRRIVVSLLQGCFVPGTPYAKRVSS